MLSMQTTSKPRSCSWPVTCQTTARARGLDVRVGEGLDAELGVLEHADARQRADLGPVVTLPRRQQDGYSLAVPGGQFLGDAIGQRPVAADDEVIAVTLRAPGKRRHAAIIVAAVPGR